MKIEYLTSRVSHALTAMAGRSSCILAYHRVADIEFDPQLLAVAPQHFAEQLEVLCENYQPMSLVDFVSNLKRGTLPRRAVALTFDDGYADNLFNAKPLLEKYSVPATAFITAGHVGHEREFWWDQLAHVLLEPGELPEEIELDVGGNPRRGKLSERTHYTEEEYMRLRSWNVGLADNPTPRHDGYRLLCKLFKTMDTETRNANIERLFPYEGYSRQARPTHRTLSESELKDLAKDGLVEVGAHTITHPLLSGLSVQHQREEIRLSKRMLEDMIGRRVVSFAYPFGTDDSYTADTVAIVREEGFSQACSNFSGRIWRLTDRYQLPRHVVRDWNGEDFSQWLKTSIIAKP